MNLDPAVEGVRGVERVGEEGGGQDQGGIPISTAISTPTPVSRPVSTPILIAAAPTPLPPQLSPPIFSFGAGGVDGEGTFKIDLQGLHGLQGHGGGSGGGGGVKMKGSIWTEQGMTAAGSCFFFCSTAGSF
jgi:hypothetical protein